MAVVGVFQNDDVFPARMRARQAQSQLIGLAAGVHKKTHAQRLGKQPRQPLGVTVDVVVKIARVGVKQRELRLRRLHHTRVAVPDERHVIVNVEIRSPRIVIQILHPPANDFQRALIRDAEVFPKQGAPCGKWLPESRFFGRKAIGRNSEQEIWSRRETRPYGTLRSSSNTWKIGPQLEQIENDLKMNVWRPAPVFLCRSDAREWLTSRNALARFQANERIFGEMPVQREEFPAIAGFMPQDDQRSIVLRSGIIRDDVDHAIQRRDERSARLNKKVHAEVNGAPFVRGIAARAERWRSVKQSRFVVTAHTNGSARAVHCVKYFFRECGSFRSPGIGAEKRAAGTQIKNNALGPPHINIQNRSRGACARFQPALDLVALRNG